MAMGEEESRLAEYLEGLSIREEEEEVVRTSQLQVQLQRTMVHAIDCRSSTCSFPNCLRVIFLFYHCVGCTTRVAGRCHLCMRTWFLLHLHARDCQQSHCTTPRCRDLKEYQQQHQVAVGTDGGRFLFLLTKTKYDYST